MAGIRQSEYKSTPAQLERSRRYRADNPQKAKDAHKAWVAANKDYLNSPERKVQQREYHRAWRKLNAKKIRQKSREYAEKNRGRIRELQKKHSKTETYAKTRLRLHLARKFKITVEQYGALLSAQNGVCKICFQPCSKKGRRAAPLNVDHDHKTGRIRGLLCSKCNSGLGYFNDDPNVIENAIAYLKGASLGEH